MKTLLICMMLLPMVAEARSPRAQMDVTEFAVDAATSSAMNITTGAVVNVVSSGVDLSSATMLEVYNADSSSYINCGYDSSVSTTSTSIKFGREIAPKTGVYFGINLDKIIVWCMSQGSSATRAVVTKMR